MSSKCDRALFNDEVSKPIYVGELKHKENEAEHMASWTCTVLLKELYFPMRIVKREQRIGDPLLSSTPPHPLLCEILR